MVGIAIGELLSEETGEAAALIEGIFREFIAPGYSLEGIDEFLRYIEPEAMRRRIESSRSGFAARDGGRIVGVIEMRDGNHISLLFTGKEYQRRGIARDLLAWVIERIDWENTAVREITVNSSPFAVIVYERMGFVRTGPEQIKNGICFIPMRKVL